MTAESREAPAAMTESHIVELENAISFSGPYFVESQDALTEILANIRSQVSGDSVSVPRAEIETVARGIMFSPLTAPHAEARRVISRWVSVCSECRTVVDPTETEDGAGISHFANCPDAKEFHSTKRRR